MYCTGIHNVDPDPADTNQSESGCTFSFALNLQVNYFKNRNRMLTVFFAVSSNQKNYRSRPEQLFTNERISWIIVRIKPA